VCVCVSFSPLGTRFYKISSHFKMNNNINFTSSGVCKFDSSWYVC